MSANLINLLIEATGQTLYMVAISALLGTLLGLPLGLFLATSQRGELLSAPWVNKVLGLVVNATRSVPFIILVVAIIPFTRMVAGTSIGTTAAIVPLTIATVPFIARLVENAIREVDSGLIEAARAYIGNDTSLLNIAAACGRPAIGFFAQTEPLDYSANIIPVALPNGRFGEAGAIGRITPEQAFSVVAETLHRQGASVAEQPVT